MTTRSDRPYPAAPSPTGPSGPAGTGRAAGTHKAAGAAGTHKAAGAGGPAGTGPGGAFAEAVGRARPEAPAGPAGRVGFGAIMWKEVVHLLLNLPSSLLAFVYVTVVVSVGAALSVTVVGLPLLAAGLAGARLVGRVERARARGLLGVRVDEPSRPPRRPGGGPVAAVWTALRDAVAWRTMLYGFVRLPWGVVTFAVTFVALFVLWPALPYLARAMANADRAMVRGLLGPSDELERRVAELESDRGVVVDTAAADLRRIERDLHDGAQARLVALAMDLGLAKEKAAEDPHAATRMVEEAHDEVKLALRELRDLARGIHPAILTDRGLDAALSAVASRCTVPVTVNADLPTRPAPAIEGIAYFTVSELLQNVSKHAHATHATVDVRRTEDRLLIQVTDDGRGGADPTTGTGLAGLTERLDAVDGLLTLHSPPGGPTTATAELPWRSRAADARR